MLTPRKTLLAVLAFVCFTQAAIAQRLDVPRRHDRPPGPPLSPEEAVARMTVPRGFSVEVVAAEPDVVNPVAMFIDEKGRFWITESFEYPRKEPGPGRDRVKVLEDTDGDGRVDKTTVFAEGLNIPSGIAVGHGGVWVANSPDILFMQDTDGDLKADSVETIVTGFGRTDTHELPNSLTWGPDGWLYGLNGVFNHSHVRYSESNPNFTAEHPGWTFTCAMFRIHPRTRAFQIFAEGTSNPWGIAINEDGEFFISACVIDHLWHIVETGYYIRQGGPYPPHTWPASSIVEHKHQKAAYCGITYFDSDAYPEEYRGVLYMGNIHGGCINADIARRHGATYKAEPHPGFASKPGAWDADVYGAIRKTGASESPRLADLLTANDAWFMPVVQKTGPDGCLYILDWYDRYHCYQDANADPEGIERSKGRLYRIRYKDAPHAKPFDLSMKSDDELIRLLSHSNVYMRETAQRLLAERDTDEIFEKLLQVVQGGLGDERDPYRALFTLGSLTVPTTGDWREALSSQDDPVARAWELRVLGNMAGAAGPDFQNSLSRYCLERSNDPSPRVRLQAAITACKCVSADMLASGVLFAALEHSADDPIIPQIVWQSLKPQLQTDPDLLTPRISESGPALAPILPRAVALLCDLPSEKAASIAPLFLGVLQSPDLNDRAKLDCTQTLMDAVLQHRLTRESLLSMDEGFLSGLKQSAAAARGLLGSRLTILRGLLGDAEAIAVIRAVLLDDEEDAGLRLEALNALIANGEPDLLGLVEPTLQQREVDPQFRATVIQTLGGFNHPGVADLLIPHWESFDHDSRSKAVEVLTQRPAWTVVLLQAIETKHVEKDALNLNQLARVASFKQEDVQELLGRVYGRVRAGQPTNRRRMVNDMADFLHGTPGDPVRGQEAFKKVCAQCHKIYGEGAEVGPDLTRNGRNSWEQLLHNVFDPSAVIGPGYQARVLVTSEGRVLTGLAVEENDQRVVLKIQGGKVETVPKDEIEEYKVSDVSMMPEELEKQLKPQEIADLFAFLALDRPPGDPMAKLLPGAPVPKSE